MLDETPHAVGQANRRKRPLSVFPTWQPLQHERSVVLCSLADLVGLPDQSLEHSVSPPPHVVQLDLQLAHLFPRSLAIRRQASKLAYFFF
jgi:hypothetical protein